MHVEAGHRNVAEIYCVPFYLFVFLYLILPALLLFAEIPVIGAIERQQINIEYLLVGIVGLFLPRSAIFSLLLVEFVSDCVFQICHVYLIQPSKLLALTSYLPLVPANRFVGGVGVVLFGIVISGVLSLFRPRKGEQLWALVAMFTLLLCALVADLCSGKNFLWRNDLGLTPRIVRSPVISLVRMESFDRLIMHNSNRAQDNPARSASLSMKSALARMGEGRHKVNVVLVLVESWGEMNDGLAERDLIDVYDDPMIVSSYRVEQGTVPFDGVTISGEARELCQSKMGFGVMQVSDSRAETCLPALLREQGYHTVAIHGYAGGMYLRKDWYRTMGFEERWFRPDLQKLGLADCKGAFPGICDTSIAQFIDQRLLNAPADQPQFIYWVTLNSHIPVPARTDIADDGSCMNKPELQASTALCSWYRLVRAVHKGMAEDAIKLRERPTVFLIVGDHAPPFGDPALRQRFSQTEVPYILLVPSFLERDREGPTNRMLGERTLVAKSSVPHAREGAKRDAEP